MNASLVRKSYRLPCRAYAPLTSQAPHARLAAFERVLVRAVNDLKCSTLYIGWGYVGKHRTMK